MNHPSMSEKNPSNQTDSYPDGVPRAVAGVRDGLFLVLVGGIIAAIVKCAGINPPKDATMEAIESLTEGMEGPALVQ